MRPIAARWDREGWIADTAIARLGEVGLLGMMVPEQWGGSYSDYVAYALAIEEIAAGCAATAALMSVHSSVGCGPILNFGTQAQKQRYLPAMALGQIIGLLLSHRAAGRFGGSQPENPGGAAERVVGSQRRETVRHQRPARQGGHRIRRDRPGSREKGISAFIVPTDAPGLEVGPPEHKLGIRGSDTCAVAFDDCRIPEDSLLGSRGKGLSIALSNLEGGRIGIAAQAVGIARAAFEAAAALFQDPPAIRSAHRRVRQHRQHAGRHADLHQRRSPAHPITPPACAAPRYPCLSEACQAKLYASEMAERVCSKAIQIHGGYGYLEEYGVERHYRDARITQIYEGTSEIQRLLIARTLLTQEELS